MNLGCLAPVAEVAGGQWAYHFKIGRPCPLENGKVCHLVTSEAGARRPRSISNLCQTRKTPTLVPPRASAKSPLPMPMKCLTFTNDNKIMNTLNILLVLSFCCYFDGGASFQKESKMVVVATVATLP
jgi:hypothetical protein